MSPDRTDWLALTQIPEVRAVAVAIHTRWRVWVGLVTPAGLVLPITGSRRAAPVKLPACERFKRCADSSGCCQSSLMEWARAGTGQLAGCHGALSAVIVPVPDRNAALYASGFMATERDYEQMAALLDRAETLAIGRPQMAALLDAVPRLTAPEREALSCLLGAMGSALIAGTPASKGTASRHDYSHIIGQSPEILRLFGILDRVVENDVTILIEGENGTGKELFARAIHANSKRRTEPFVTQNCAAINDNLLESELFGHLKGAFTGAISDKRGLFAQADGGTLFLDEVGDMSPTMQMKLLRVLQEGTFNPVGGTVTRRVDVRIIAASNRQLNLMVSEGAFREDLFYRLNVINLVVPPLRSRQGDLSLLADYFARDYARRTGGSIKRLADGTLRLLRSYSWPGNVRELRHEVERLVVLSGEGAVIEPDQISARIIQSADPSAADIQGDDASTLPQAVRALERRMILEALHKTGWNKTRTARRLGISRRNLIRKVQTYELERPLAPEPE